jgi:hypothetical protein
VLYCLERSSYCKGHGSKEVKDIDEQRKRSVR